MSLYTESLGRAIALVTASMDDDQMKSVNEETDRTLKEGSVATWLMVFGLVNLVVVLLKLYAEAVNHKPCELLQKIALVTQAKHNI